MPVLDQTLEPGALLDLAMELDGRPVPGVRMTEQQFHDWCSPALRAEWVQGEVTVMSPASTEHADLNLWLGAVLRLYVEADDLGRVLGVESQVRLSTIPSRRNPDLLFVARARASIIKTTYVDGPPDLVMEIVSPDSESRDWREKYLEYEASGVREYWVIEHASRHVEAYSLAKSRKYRRLEETNGRVLSKVLRGFYLKPAWLWQSPLPKIAPILKELTRSR